jgi:predicted DNA-binding ArsR family transcriptional regulator
VNVELRLQCWNRLTKKWIKTLKKIKHNVGENTKRALLVLDPYVWLSWVI